MSILFKSCEQKCAQLFIQFLHGCIQLSLYDWRATDLKLCSMAICSGHSLNFEVLHRRWHISQPQICISPVLKVGIGDRRATVPYMQKHSIYSDDFLSHGMSALSQYFHLVSTKCKMNKILDIFIYRKYNRKNLKTPLKSQDGNKFLQLNLIDYILTPSWVPSRFVLQHRFTSYFKYIFITCMFIIFCSSF